MCHLARTGQVKGNLEINLARLPAAIQEHRQHWSERRKPSLGLSIFGSDVWCILEDYIQQTEKQTTTNKIKKNTHKENLKQANDCFVALSSKLNASCHQDGQTFVS